MSVSTPIFYITRLAKIPFVKVTPTPPPPRHSFTKISLVILAYEHLVYGQINDHIRHIVLLTQVT